VELTEDELVQILKWVEESAFDELNLETGDLKLMIRKKSSLGLARELDLPALPAASTSTTSTVEVVKNQETVRHKDMEYDTQKMIQEGLVPIKAPILGTFYRCPEPSAPPYVDVGDLVKEDDTVCLIEVMKIFSAVKSEVSGYIEKVLVESGQLVEYGQILFLVNPHESSTEQK